MVMTPAAQRALLALYDCRVLRVKLSVRWRELINEGFATFDELQGGYATVRIRNREHALPWVKRLHEARTK